MSFNQKNQKFKKSLLAAAIVCGLSFNTIGFADELSSNDLLDLNNLLDNINSGKSVSVDVSSDKPVVPNDTKKETTYVKKENEQKPVVPVQAKKEEPKPVEEKKEEVKPQQEVNKEEKSQVAETPDYTNVDANTNVDAIIEKTEKTSEQNNDVVNIMNDSSIDDNEATKEDVSLNDASKSDVVKYLESKKAIKNDIENGTSFHDSDMNEDLDYVKEKAHIIDLERKAREDELKRLAAIKYIEKSENVPVNNYSFSVTFNENRFFREKIDRSVSTFKQYILTANQKEAIAPEVMPKNDTAKGYKNVSTLEVNNEGQEPKKYELGVKYILQILDFDTENNRIQLRIDANNSQSLASYYTFDNKKIQETNTKLTKTYSHTETFWINNAKNAKKSIDIGNGVEVVISLDSIVKNTEVVNYKVVDPTDGKAAENEKLIKEQQEKAKAEETKKLEDAKKAEEEKKKEEEKNKGFFGKFF